MFSQKSISLVFFRFFPRTTKAIRRYVVYFLAVCPSAPRRMMFRTPLVASVTTSLVSYLSECSRHFIPENSCIMIVDNDSCIMIFLINNCKKTNLIKYTFRFKGPCATWKWWWTRRRNLAVLASSLLKNIHQPKPASNKDSSIFAANRCCILYVLGVLLSDAS